MYSSYPVFFLSFFLFYGVTSKLVQDGKSVSISCDPQQDRLVLWFHLKESSGPIEFLASFSGGVHKAGQQNEKFNFKGKTLTLNNFKKHNDSGIYGCVSVNSNKLIFGDVTHLFGEPDPTPKYTPRIPTTTKPQEIATTKNTVQCQPSKKKAHQKVEAILGCELYVFIPLLVGSGLLFILLLIFIFYCNHIRTRRCPHHYKRQPRNIPTGHKALQNPPGL